MKLAAEDVEDDEMFVDCDGDFDDVENGASSSSPGKKSELKRPDLKGTFHCSVCAKVFCHSSSLSRHRMQAHFKSYKCTLCPKDITSNESLRTHMYKHHRISRMFMCRCCNWAFSDKTSLHEHVQNIKEGKIASNKPLILPTASESTSAPTSVIRAPVPLQSPLNSLFSLSGDLRERFLLTQLLVQQSQLFPAPLPNPFVPSLESVKIQRNSTEIETEAKERSFEGVRPDSGLSLSDEDASNCSIKNFHASPSSSRSEPSAFQPLQKLSMCPSPTPSATNTSSASTSSPSSVSPQESSACFECEDLRTKVKAAESRTSFLEAQVEVLKTELAQTRSQLSVSELAVSNSQMETQLLRQHNEMFQRRLLECQALAVQFLQSGIERTPSAADVAGLLNQIVAATIVR